MTRFSIRIEAPDKIQEALRKAIEERLDKALNDIADFIGSESDRILRDSEEGSFDTGFLAGSLVVDKDDFLYKEVGYGALYASYIEFGTRPHFPPVEVIYQWVYRKRNDLKINYNKKKEVLFNGKPHNADILKVAWSIANKMAKDGTEPKPFMRPSFILGKSKAGEFIKKAMK